MFDELRTFEALVERIESNLNVPSEFKRIASVEWNGLNFPIDIIVIGNQSKEAPCLGFFSGVHGVERIGAQVVLAFLESLIERLYWDETLQILLNKITLVFMPIVNPVGIFQQSRCNGNHVDLMRNAPVDAVDKVPHFVGGHRISKRLPWYRGKKGDPMEIESQALVDVVNNYVVTHNKSLTVDCHSGFGWFDRLWFPYAYSSKPYKLIAEVTAIKNIFDISYPYHHYYQIEPQSLAYQTNGDLWDYLAITNEDKDFIPLTLEMGSWLWLKKNPRQIFDVFGAYHPVKEHRIKRVLRQHMPLLDFLVRVIAYHKNWWPEENRVREHLWHEAINLWYSH